MNTPVLKGAGIVVCHFVFMLSVCFSSNTRANDPHDASIGMTLSRAIALTLENNPALQIFELRDQSLLADTEIADQKPAYRVGVELENVLGTGAVQLLDASELSVSLSSVIELGGKRQARRDLVSARQAQLAVDKEIRSLDLLTDLTLRYIDVLTVQAQIGLAAQSVDLSKEMIASIARRNRAGLLPDADLQRARIAEKEANLALTNLQAEHDLRKAVLANAWGAQTVNFARVEGDLFQLGETRDKEGLFAEMLARPDLHRFITESRLIAAQHALAQTQRNADWEWSLGIRHFNETDDVGFMGAISMPLGQAQRMTPTLEKLRLLAEENTLQEAQIKRQLRVQLEQFFSQRSQALHQIAVLRDDIIPMLEKVLRETRYGYHEGRYAYLDLITARQSLITARARLITSASDALKNAAQMERLTGLSLFQLTDDTTIAVTE